MTQPTRRDVLMKTAPALALAGVMAGVGQVMGQEGPTVDAAHAGSPVAKAIGAGFAAGKYALPSLANASESLDPHIDPQSMALHHSKPHPTYVDGLNKSIKTLADLRASGAEPVAEQLAGLQRNISSN